MTYLDRLRLKMSGHATVRDARGEPSTGSEGEGIYDLRRVKWAAFRGADKSPRAPYTVAISVHEPITGDEQERRFEIR